MSTKPQIKSTIDTILASGTSITATELRSVFKDDADSILINMYPTEITDDEISESFLTLTTPGSATFDIRILKTGRKISISGTIIAISAILNIGVITAGELTSTNGKTYRAVGFETTGKTAKEVSIVNSSGITTLLINPELAISDVFNFTIFYNSDS